MESPRPHYPRAAAAKRIQGRVTVLALVGADGRIARVRAVAGAKELRDAALESARGYVFTPAVKDGRPVETVVMIEVSFKLL